MENRLEHLLSTRRERLEPDTNAYRVVPEGMLWRGVSVDALAGRYLVSLRDAEMPKELEEWLRASRADVFIKRLAQGDKRASHPMFQHRKPHGLHRRAHGVRLMMDMQSGYSQGLFIDQRDNRLRLRRICRPGMKALNLFAYTGAFSVCAALAGAQTTTLDLAQACLTHCRENMQSNGVDPSLHFFCKGDALHWLGSFARQGRLFDVIILDPPTFSRDARGRVWRAERDYAELVKSAARCLAEHGRMLCTTNCRSLSSAAFRSMVEAGAPAGAQLEEQPMPFDFAPENYLKTVWIHS